MRLVLEMQATLDDEDEVLFYLNLIALLASRLDELEPHCKGSSNAWKLKPVETCCVGREEALRFLGPWLNNNVKLTAGPLVKWFNERTLDSVEERRRANALRGLVEKVVGTGVYDARVRTGLRQVADDIKVSWSKDIVGFEGFLAKELAAATMNATNKVTRNEWTFSRIAKVSAAAAVGGTLVALTAGAAAPIVAPLVGGILATNAAASVALSIGLFGAAGAGLTGYKMADRTKRGLEEFFFDKVNRGNDCPSFHIVIGVSGTMESENLENLQSYWTTALSYEADAATSFGLSDLYIMIYDRKNLIDYTRTIRDLLKDQVVSYAYSYFLKQVLGHALMAAVSLPMTVVNAFNIVNNNFAICEARAKDAGIELAEALRTNCQGARPVTLVGFGFGALSIFYALERLADEGSYGIVEAVVLACVPLRATPVRWANVRRMVAGEFYNIYCEEDWTIKLAMQWSESSATIAGVETVNLPGIVDVKIDKSHFALGNDGGIAMRGVLEMLIS